MNKLFYINNSISFFIIINGVSFTLSYNNESSLSYFSNRDYYFYINLYVLLYSTKLSYGLNDLSFNSNSLIKFSISSASFVFF